MERVLSRRAWRNTVLRGAILQRLIRVVQLFACCFETKVIRRVKYPLRAIKGIMFEFLKGLLHPIEERE